MSIPSSAFTNMFHLDLEFENYSEEIMLSFVPQPVSIDFTIATVDFDRLYDLITYDALTVPYAIPTLNRDPKKRTTARVEVFEDMGLGDAPDLSPLPEIEMTYAQEFPSIFGRTK